MLEELDSKTKGQPVKYSPLWREMLARRLFGKKVVKDEDDERTLH